MADKEKDEPSLELPSLALRWKRSKSEEPLPARSQPRPHDEPEAVATPAVEQAAEPTDDSGARTPAEPTAVLLDEPTSQTVPEAEDHEPVPMETSAAHAAGPGVEPTHPPATGTRKAARTGPVVSAPLAAALVGLLVGALTVGLTWASLHLCSSVRGTSSCGNPGALLLLAIVVVMIVVGGLALRSLGVPDSGTTSLLGMVLMTAVMLVVFVRVLDEWWIAIALPVVAAVTYAVAEWTTRTFVEPGDRPR